MIYKRITFILCVYPLVTGIFYIIQYFELASPTAVQTLITTSILIPLIDLDIIPFLKTRMK